MSTSDLSARFFGCPIPKPFEEYGGKDARIRVIPVVRKKYQTDENGVFINCTSSGEGAEMDLSPFTLGPCRLYGNYTARRMENGWQFSKVYLMFVADDNRSPIREYFEWAEKGWASGKAERYPMGKEMNGKELFHWWDGQPLNKVEARKRIYVPLYAEQVVKREFFKRLKKIWDENKEHEEFTLYLMDFGTKPRGNKSLSEILNDPKESMGHGSVLAMLLLDDPALRECQLR